ncbi:MAG: bifunctional diaminohydroxyphosphoribosylaminopyrimidine deaminase/5-amino-6-(5-phosphoribosylamino)uracil reductase RibD [Candidatus Omnitrophica bacterium]|nr:bifunctional diaminohydroxyphosphoribosylaminopyrimidine deaminase/5-amino-6-(5-phosphoribosylamino)uracil reductase RibD [Candidatus Omnitrophota bacterium]
MRKEINNMNIREKYMNLALRLALKAQGKTSPNPMVGALVVKNGKIVGKGYHEKAGSSHAEVIALDEAEKKSRGACLYVTLEPCAHFGKTPPCVDRIIKSGIKEVMVGMLDPNPLNNGEGIRILKQNKIKVQVGFLENRLRKINEVFIKYITKRMPFVTVKVGQSLDGKIATKSGDSKWITSDKSRVYAHRLRRNYDAIMVGVNTILRDNPMLDTWFYYRYPIKVVVDSQLSTPEDANIFSKNRPVIIATLYNQPGQETDNRRILAAKARILEIKEKEGQINLKDMLKKLAQLGIANILVEGGGTLIGSFFDEGLVDKVLFFISPKIIGGKEALSSIMGRGISRIDKAVKLKDVKLKKIGEDFLVEGYVK